MNLNNAEGGAYLEVAKAAILAFAKNNTPKVCVEFARRTVAPQYRPDFREVDQATSALGKK